MLVDNPWIKPPQWYARHAYTRRGFCEPSNWQRNGVALSAIPLELQTIVADQDHFGLPAVRCLVGKYAGKDATEMDSGKIFGRPGTFTPPQLNCSENTFEEIPLSGRMIFLGVRDGVFTKQLFDIAPRQNASLVPAVKQGDIMRWFFCSDQKSPPSKLDELFWPNCPTPNIEILEHVYPGFASAELVTIHENATSVGNISIPTEFWDTCHLLESGQEAMVIANTPVVV